INKAEQGAGQIFLKSLSRSLLALIEKAMTHLTSLLQRLNGRDSSLFVFIFVSRRIRILVASCHQNAVFVLGKTFEKGYSVSPNI
ncbi:hypothetical protein Q0M59_16680, partial [Staphylococcus aureus]|nr:hypothetical protein [Staphylococcus aureus]